MSRSTAPKPGPTHAQLVEVAARWLRRTRGCSVVLTELVAAIAEIPDAIGWRRGSWSVLVECKTSRSDFRRDGEKRFRDPTFAEHFAYWAGVGQERYYLAPKGLLMAAEMPEGWGLIEWDGRRVQYALKLEEYKMTAVPARSVVEVPLLISALRRLQEGGINAAALAIAGLGPGDLAIARRVLERRERALAGLPVDAAEDFDPAPPEADQDPWAALMDQ